MSFPSKYNFTCDKCGKAGLRGEQISWSRKERGKVYHADCNNAPPSVVPATPSEDVFLCRPCNTKFRTLEALDMHTTLVHSSMPSYKTCPDCSALITEGYAIKEVDGVTYHLNCSPTQNKTENKTMLVKDDNKPTESNNAMDVFINAIVPQLENKLKSKVDEKSVNALIEKAIRESQTPTVLEVKLSDTGDMTRIERPHKDLKTLLYFISKKQHVYLYGPAGSGKSTAAQHCAEALKIEFGYISLNPQTPDSRILGFIDAGGTYRETPFFKCYKNGGIFCIDEMDNASAALLTTLNSMLENGHGAFPCGLVPRHDNFVLVATGNTNGRGGNPMFPERRPFDAAFAERFTFMFWDYDGALERAVTLSINPKAEAWLQWVGKLRSHCAKHFPRVLISPRASFKGAEYLQDSGMSIADIAEAVVFKGLDQDTIKKIVIAVPYPSSSDVKAMAVSVKA